MSGRYGGFSSQSAWSSPGHADAPFRALGTSLSGTIGAFTATLALGDTDNDIIRTVVPEPGSAVLLLGGLAMLAGRRRRK